jgi:TolB-like protein/Tfp pilus assembly protein PilF
MKRCPDCRRDYYDDSLLYCLDDGSALLDGPGSMDEPATAILHESAPPAEAKTRAQIHTTGPTAIMPGVATEAERSKGFDKRLIIVPVAIAILVLGGFFGYRSFRQAGQIESIAVMPFVNETGNAEVEYLSDGMTETLIKGLSNIPNLNVKPRSTVFRYKGKDTDLKTIARELNVQAILNGRVTQRGEQLTLSLELIDIPNDKVIWTEQYQRRQSDVVALQSEIAKDVSASIKAKLTGTEEQKVTSTGTTDPEAYQAYLRGRYLWNRRTAANINKALEQFTIATQRDPNYALAFVGLADCYVVLNEYAGVPAMESMPKAKEYAQRALALDSQLAEAYATLGSVAEYEWNSGEAEENYKRAIALNPNYPTAYHWYSIRLRAWGRYDEAAAMIRRAQELDPVSSVIAVNVARTQQLQKNDPGAIETLLKLTEADPVFPAAHQYIALSYLRQGRPAEAVASSEKAVELSNRSGITLGDLGFVYGSVGQKEKARAIIRELEAKWAERKAGAINIAMVYAGLGEKDAVFEWLEKEFDARGSTLQQIGWMIEFESVREDPRLKDMLRRMNLPEPRS